VAVGDKGDKIPALDGLRGISIGLVLLAHLTGTRDVATGARLFDLDSLGTLGVRIFFVISGFLITLLLLQERARTGSISLPRFYLRRALRIFPAAYFYMGVVFLAAALGLLVLAPGDRLHALTYTVNYHHLRSWYVSHLWSLSVEEQFYLIWPALLLLFGARGALWLAFGLVVAAPQIRMAIWLHWPERRIEIGEAFTTIGDAIATGCLLAGLRARLGQSGRYLGFLRSPWFVAVPLLVVVANAFQRYPAIDFLFGETLMNVAIALTIDRCVRVSGDWVRRLLDSPPLAGLGVLSYSLYLWQEPFLNRFSHSPATLFPFNLMLALAAAAASHYFVERPFLRWRQRLRRAHPVRAEGG
jgi:peptidoglycan/LPS O-acetylase OafA/YrhL